MNSFANEPLHLLSPFANLRAAALALFTLSACRAMSFSNKACFCNKSSTSSKCFPKSGDISRACEQNQ